MSAGKHGFFSYRAEIRPAFFRSSHNNRVLAGLRRYSRRARAPEGQPDLYTGRTLSPRLNDPWQENNAASLLKDEEAVDTDRVSATPLARMLDPIFLFSLPIMGRSDLVPGRPAESRFSRPNREKRTKERKLAREKRIARIDDEPRVRGNDPSLSSKMVDLPPKLQSFSR